MASTEPPSTSTSTATTGSAASAAASPSTLSLSASSGSAPSVPASPSASPSPSSSSSSSSPSVLALTGEGDVAAKFQRLVAEYDKIKKQHTILKKAVLAEQAKNRDLEVKAKEQEVKLRKSMEDNELLGFNNQRLTKRIAQMQQQLHEDERRNEGGGWFSMGAKQELAQRKRELSVMQQELTVKISENEHLHITMFELKKAHQMTLEELNQKLLTLKRTVQLQQDEMLENESRHKEEVVKVKTQFDEVCHRMKYFQDALTKANEHMKDREQQMEVIQTQLEGELQKATESLHQKVMFDDTRIDQYNRLNLPGFKFDNSDKGLEVLENALGTFWQFVQATSDGHEAHVQVFQIKAKLTPDSNQQLLHLNAKVQGFVSEHTKHIEAIYQALVAMSKEHNANPSAKLSDTTSVALCNVVKRYVAFHSKYISYRIMSIDATTTAATGSSSGSASSSATSSSSSSTTSSSSSSNSMSSSPQSPSALNSKDSRTLEASFSNTFALSLQRVQAALERVLSYLELIFRPELQRNQSRTNRSHVLKQFASSMDRLRDALEHSSDQLCSQIKQENNNPFARPELRQVNERLLSSQNASRIFLSRAIGFLSEYIHRSSSVALSQVCRGAKPQLHDCEGFTERARNFAMSLSAYKEPDSVPYVKALEIRDTLKRYITENQQLQDEIARLQETIGRMDHEKLALDTELAKTKDSVASKQSQMSTLMSDLAATRKKLETLNESYRKQQELIRSGAAQAGDADTELAPEDDDTALLARNPFLSALTGPARATATTLEEEEGLTSQYTITVIDETGAQTETLGVTKEDRERETAIKRFFETKMAQLTTKMKLVDEKACRFQTEYDRVAKRLDEALQSNSECKTQLGESLEQLKVAKEDLDVTRNNYEKQLQLLTEHFVKLNEQVSKQEEQLSRLKSHKVNCGKCGTWNTVQWLLTDGSGGKRCSRGNHPSSYNFV